MRTGNNDMRAGRRYSNMDKMNHIVPVHLLINIDITKYFSCTLRFYGVFERHNLFRITYGVYFINLNDKQSKEIHWVSLFINRNKTMNFDPFWNTEYIPQQVLSKIKYKSITMEKKCRP